MDGVDAMDPPTTSPGPAGSPSGLLVIDKPTGMTSMHVCRIVRRRLVNAGAPKRVKVGHGGTLDPLATGVLVVLVGKATKLCERIMAGRKRYIADVDLAHRSTTDDAEGELTEVAVARSPSREEIEAALAGFMGTIMQRPPDYSAIKVGGKRAYKIARHQSRERKLAEAERAETPIPPPPPAPAVPLQPRPVHVHSIALLEYHWPRLVLDITCGKGTYIRSIARDLGEAIGTGGMLTALRRTEVAPFALDEALTLEKVPDPLPFDFLRPIEPMLRRDASA